MTSPFAQSMNALKADRGTRSLFAIVLTLLFLLAWLLWFLYAPLPVYETGEVIGIRRDGRLRAAFPAEVLAFIRPGQDGYIQVGDPSSQLYAGQQKAMVVDVSTTVVDSQIEVILEREFSEAQYSSGAYSRNDDGGVEALDPSNESPIWVTVTVDEISPAVLVLRTSGQFIEARPISFGSR